MDPNKQNLSMQINTVTCAVVINASNKDVRVRKKFVGLNSLTNPQKNLFN
jgi:hypothetical protein